MDLGLYVYIKILGEVKKILGFYARSAANDSLTEDGIALNSI